MSRLLSIIMLMTSVIETGTSPVLSNCPSVSVEFVATVATWGAAGLYRRRKSSTQVSDAKAGMASIMTRRMEAAGLTDLIKVTPYRSEDRSARLFLRDLVPWWLMT